MEGGATPRSLLLAPEILDWDALRSEIEDPGGHGEVGMLQSKVFTTAPS